MPSQEALIPEIVDEQERRARVREKQIANLIPFRPGESGNPAGRKPGGAYVQEFVNSFLMVNDDGTPRYTREELETIVEDPQSAPAAVAAARQVLQMTRDPRKWVRDKHGKVYPGGSDPEVGRAFDRVMDRLVGKPEVTATITHNSEQRTPAEINRRVMQMLGANPGLREYLIGRMVEHLDQNPALRDYLTHMLPSDEEREIIDQEPRGD